MFVLPTLVIFTALEELKNYFVSTTYRGWGIWQRCDGVPSALSTLSYRLCIRIQTCRVWMPPYKPHRCYSPHTPKKKKGKKRAFPRDPSTLSAAERTLDSLQTSQQTWEAPNLQLGDERGTGPLGSRATPSMQTRKPPLLQVD